MMKPPCFFTDSGKEVPALTGAQIREVDRIAIQETGPNLFQMMETAGRNLAEMALERLGGDWQNARIVVLAGTGGNGGGGITAARHLTNRGARVELCRAVPDGLSEVADSYRGLRDLSSLSQLRVLLCMARRVFFQNSPWELAKLTSIASC